ncbi:MAG: thioredoxin family protein [Rubripirellula sp.]|jgi:peroxiredoxin|nr:thioredoxin family protein [Planctomycetaceae bacterium]MDF1844375.1 thioredoxin family protein [Rubripirellula sp.]
MTNRLFVPLLVVLLGSLSSAGEYNRVLSIGDQAPVWKELTGVDGKKSSLTDLKSKSVLVVVFTCNTCPYSVDAEDRMIALQKAYQDRNVSLVAINVNKVEADLLPAMKQRAEEKKFPFSYLHDPTQQIAKQYGAVYTPEFYVLNQQRRIVYMGSLDDSPDGRNVAMRYVELAIEATLAGQKPQISETIPIGCRVRYERERRSRKSK